MMRRTKDDLLARDEHGNDDETDSQRVFRQFRDRVAAHGENISNTSNPYFNYRTTGKPEILEEPITSPVAPVRNDASRRRLTQTRMETMERKEDESTLRQTVSDLVARANASISGDILTDRPGRAHKHHLHWTRRAFVGHMADGNNHQCQSYSEQQDTSQLKQKESMQRSVVLTAKMNESGDDNNESWIRFRFHDKMDCWNRMVRLSDHKFVWRRVDDNGDVIDTSNQRFDIDRSAFCRKLQINPGDDPSMMWTGHLSLVPASNVSADSNVKSPNGGGEVITFEDISNAQTMAFDEKAEWFHRTCQRLSADRRFTGGRAQPVRINVRRSNLLRYSIDAVMSLSIEDMKRPWRFDFNDEQGDDCAAGLSREWLYLVTREMFDPAMGLWMPIKADSSRMQINPLSGKCCTDHLVYYRFFGRVMGRALFDWQPFPIRLDENLYRFMLSWPVTFSDLEHVDEESYRRLKHLLQDFFRNDDKDISGLCLNFTTTNNAFGQSEEVELVAGGRDIDVNEYNLLEYVEAFLKHQLLGRVQSQLKELLLGFFEVVPEPLLSVFDVHELDCLMCGLKRDRYWRLDAPLESEMNQSTICMNETAGTTKLEEVARPKKPKG